MAPALYEPGMGRFMKQEEALCNLSLTCQLLLFLSLGGEEAERLRTEISAMLPSRRVTLHESTTLGLLVKGEHRREAGRTSEESLRGEGGLTASFPSLMALPETDPAFRPRQCGPEETQRTCVSPFCPSNFSSFRFESLFVNNSYSIFSLCVRAQLISYKI